jgi:hypothetical protein
LVKHLRGINLTKLAGLCTSRCAEKNFKRKWNDPKSHRSNFEA